MLRLSFVRRANQCLYSVLGVSPNASLEEIKSAFREKAKESHPDAGGTEAGFRELVEAYKVLRDPTKRATYNNKTGRSYTGEQWPRGEAGNMSESFRSKLYGEHGAPRQPPEPKPDVVLGPSEQTVPYMVAAVLFLAFCFRTAVLDVQETAKDKRAENPPTRRPGEAPEGAGITKVVKKEVVPRGKKAVPVPVEIPAEVVAEGPAGLPAEVPAGAAARVEPQELAQALPGAPVEPTQENADDLVLAYYNPFSTTWHRIPEGFEPPGVVDLTAFHHKRTDPAEWGRLFGSGELCNIIPKGALQVRYKAFWDTHEPVLVKDPHTKKTIEVGKNFRLLDKANACGVEF